MNSSVSPHVDQGQRKLAVSYKEAAASLGVCERTIWTLVHDKELAAIRIGRSVRIPIAELERFVARQQS